MDPNGALFERALRVLPGGVNSPVRAFGAVGGTPGFVQSANGSKLYFVNGGHCIDYVCSWGPLILGHNAPVIRKAVADALERGISYGAPCADEVELAELMCSLVPGLEMLRLTSSGTEACMSALRLARHITGRSKIIKFEGCYHGHSDGLLVKAGSGALTFGSPDSGGVPEAIASLTLTAVYNDIESVRALFSANPEEIAAVIIEPVAANMGVVLPANGFLAALKKLCAEYGALLIFDEVITGFRLGPGGAAAYFGVTPDLYAFGKIIGGGLPVGAFGGSRAHMSAVAPLGPVYQAGTLSGNPAAMAAGLAQIKTLANNSEIYAQIDSYANELANALKTIEGLTVNRVGSLLTAFFTDRAVESFADAKSSDTKKYAEFFHKALEGGVYPPPSQFEAWFVSAAHDEHDLRVTIECLRNR